MAFTDGITFPLRSCSTRARYLVGVSGGRDSVALLHELFAIGYRRLVVCHLNHGLRGKAAQADVRFVQRLATTMGLQVEAGRVNVAAMARSGKLSIETAAREARYQFFAEVAQKYRCRTLFLAHQADDQVETFLFNLLRGSGPTGLTAMTMDRIRTVGQPKLRIIRPLLSVWRTEVDEYLLAKGLKWREDATNADPTYGTRNRLRAEVLPLLERTISHEVKMALWQTAHILGDEEVWKAGLMKEVPKLPVEVPLAALTNQPTAKQRRMIQAWLLAAHVPRVGYREIELVRSLLDKIYGPSKINLPANWHARRRAGMLFLERTGGDP